MSILRRLQKYPRILETAYRMTVVLIRRLEPILRKIGLERLLGLFFIGEKMTKGAIFDCQMCGQCILHDTGMTCPMTCPKNMRNGPCGGVRMNGKCEIIPEMDCIWVKAWERAESMNFYGDKIQIIQAPLDKRLQDTSSWLNMLDQRDIQKPINWISLNDIPTTD
jgi:methylene-tetrahydrofolate reductase-like protein